MIRILKEFFIGLGIVLYFLLRLIAVITFVAMTIYLFAKFTLFFLFCLLIFAIWMVGASKNVEHN